MQVLPGILEKDFSEIEKKLQIVKPFAKRVHIDFLDGKFSPESNFIDSLPFAKYKDDFFLEAHLMVDNPTSFLTPLSQSGFKRFIGHIEKMQDIDEFIALGQVLGEVGIAFDYQTPLETLTVSYDDLDVILLMGVKAGKSGQEFLPETLEKIQKLRALTQIPIEIDGGINEKTLVDSKSMGANRFVATSCIFKSQDPMESYEKLIALNS